MTEGKIVVKPTILIADDEAGIVDMLCAYFSPRYDVLTACSGQEAIRRGGAAARPDPAGYQYARN